MSSPGSAPKRACRASAADEMSAEAFVHRIEIRASPARLHAFLCDLHNYLPLHPLIESIDELPPTPEMPSARRYRVVDRVPFGPFRMRAAYTAALEPTNPLEVHGHAWQFPGIRVHTVYTLGGIPAGTRLTERVAIVAPLLVRRFVVAQARKAHHETLERMRVLLEKETDDGAPPAGTTSMPYEVSCG